MNSLSALHDMVLIVEVSRTRSFSVAGRNLGVSNATLSRRIAALEARLGLQLFERTTRHVELTDAGTRYVARCAHLVDEVRLAEEALLDTASLPTGHLRLSMPADVGIHMLGPALHAFGRRYPDITFDIDLSSLHRDHVGEQVDVSFRVGAVAAERLIVRRIGWVPQPLYAAPSYLAANGRPRMPADLPNHECIIGRNPRPEEVWQLSDGRQTEQITARGRYMTNDAAMMRMLAESGAGISPLQPALAQEAVARGHLERVLADWQLPSLPLYAVTTSRLQPARVKVLIEFLATSLAS
ncbi:LysR family transcriptional regulator [Labrys monachus]|uniref:DNA-binding transcriptional LysR family regulator n=1 Tax=Labrys monachus TaxID=217067 RepID=A0ABU0FMV2_9HYPH|nr:LysR family transcriptional regulator [Labrys monachus]MDQ0395841.1 DNA-binding transcriptional LysR family regulator [Labrys monachus]